MNLDRTLINIGCILLGGAGLFTVLTGFNVPEVHASFYGRNPFALKRDVIESAMAWTFTILAMGALLVQVGAEIWGTNLPERSHGTRYYAYASAAMFVGVCVLVVALTVVARRIARLSWEPKVVDLQRKIFDRAKFVANHDGLLPEHWEARDRTPPAEIERLKSTDLEAAEQDIAQIEKLLELNDGGDLRGRLARLEPIFAQK